jgi:acyl dehydratase
VRDGELIAALDRTDTRSLSEELRRTVSDLYFQDLKVGHVFETAAYTVGRREILDFARAFDPNPFHLDDGAARERGLPGIVASGFHTLSLSFRLFFELHLWDEAIMPSPGLDKVRWLKPLFPDQTIMVRATVLEAKLSNSKPDRGIVLMRHETLDVGSAEPILIVDAMHRLKVRAEAGVSRPH